VFSRICAHTRRLGAASVLAVAVCAAFLVGNPDALISSQAPSCDTTTASGDVQGLLRGGTCTYLGIPYAAPPTGNLRWRPPQPRAAWTTTLSATVAPPVCPNINQGPPQGNEDCLRLNIWTPAITPQGRGLPVIVWLHTGGFQAASANFAASDGRRFAEERGAIVAAPNYRVGPLGFLAHSALTAEGVNYPSSGNYGFADQRAALQWIRTNIHAFGGDPDNVTLAGTSAGGQSTGLHMVSPFSRGLFQHAIIQSGSVTLRWRTSAEAEAQGEALAAALGCTDRASVLTCLRSRSYEQVLLAIPVGQAQIVEDAVRIQWGPVVDGFEIPDQPRELFRRGLFARVPVLLGTNRDEGWTYVDRSFSTGVDPLQYQRTVEREFGMDAAAVLALYPTAQFATPKDALSRLIGDVEHTCEARRLARFLHHEGAPVYAYSFEYVVDPVTAGRSFHGLESNLVFGNNFAPPPAAHALTATDNALFRTMSSYWHQFAETGNPNALGMPAVWPLFRGVPKAVPWDAVTDRYLVLDGVLREAANLRDRQCNFWDPFFFRSALGAVPAGAR
jgi:para-nitrobenzyl esterase